MDKVGNTITLIITGVIGLAIVAVVLSSRASTSSVLGAGGSALANVIAAAVSPITGNTVTPNVGSGGGGGGLGSIFGGGGGNPLSSILGGGGGGFSPMSLLSSGSFGAGFL